MGYAGYVPAKLPPARPSAVQAALWQIKALDSLETICKLLRNAAVNPSEAKYRRIKLTNAKIKSAIVDEPGALEFLILLGWVHDPADNESLVVSEGRRYTMTDVRLVQDAQERLKKFERDEKRSSAASKLPTNSTQERIRQQMEADRLERASRAS